MISRLRSVLACVPVVLLTASTGAAAAGAAGVRELLVPSDASGPQIQARLWTPCATPRDSTTANGGPIRSGTRTAEDCAPSGRGLPLVVISHGMFGDVSSHQDTAEALADAGFAVVSISHPQDEASASKETVDNISSFLVRPVDIKRAISFVVSDPGTPADIDPRRIGFFGFSRGGYTGLVLAGAAPDFQAPPFPCSDEFLMCRQMREGKIPSHAPAHDPRIRAFVIADPVSFFPDRASLKGVTAPVQLWSSDHGGMGVRPEDVASIRANLPGSPEFHRPANTAHLSFNTPCADESIVCADPPGFDRAAFHRDFNAEVVRFFHEKLAGEADRPALRDAFRGAFTMGTAVNDAVVSGRDAAAQELVLRHFGSITAENVLKAEPLNPRPGVWNFGPADAFVAFGEQHGTFIVGHTLVWHNQTPAWFFQDENGAPRTPAAQIERMRQHIEAVAGRYAGRVHAWDVVNEVIDNDGSYRPTAWVKAVGSGAELVKAAFRFAQRYAPGAELYYNDFNAWRPAKRDGIVRMVKMLQAAGIRIDGIGMQGHWGLDYPKSEYVEAAIDAYAALGVKVMITELDVDVLPLTRQGQVIGTVMSDPQFRLEEFEAYLDPWPDGLPPDVERQVAQRWSDLFRIFYGRRDKIDRVTLWGVHDGMSWKNGYPVPGRTNYPLLFGRDLRPKPAFDAVVGVPRR